MPILTDAMKKYVLTEDKSNWNKSAYNSRIRNYATQGLEDLTLLADRLPEEQLAKIFNEKTLNDFFKALLKIRILAENHEDWKRIKETRVMRLKRVRLLKICWAILTQMGNRQFVASLVPSNWKPWLRGEYPPIRNLEVILRSQQIELE